MGKRVRTRRARGRPAIVALLAAATLLVLAVAAPAAFGVPAWVHGGASCGTGCHVTNAPPGPGTNAECQACHTGFQRRSGAPQDCWSCHAPGQDTAPFKQQTGCVGVCHMYVPATNDYTNDQTPHPQPAHYASNVKTCRSCHGVATGIKAPDGSPHHDARNSVAPTAADCLVCHGAPVVDAAPRAHPDLGTGVTDCQHCHVGMAARHPTAVQLVTPKLTATAARSAANVIIRGTLKRGTVAVVNFTGWVQWRGPADTTWDEARQLPLTTNTSGAYTQLITAPLVGTAYRVIFEGGISGTVTLTPSMARVATNLTLKLSATTIRFGQRVRASGTVTPARTGKVTVTVQRKNLAGRWVKLTASARTLSATGGYSWPYKPPRKGVYRMQAKIGGTALFAADASPWRTFRVR